MQKGNQVKDLDRPATVSNCFDKKHCKSENLQNNINTSDSFRGIKLKIENFTSSLLSGSNRCNFISTEC
ncbi:hypothetical protein SAMN05444362_103203 [Dysgonomonas macrotermitis]|uniref:Uncharacterized protein n=1 Tax=Dysgonomonas macrotermitis TaxID=1346286 RepID=A0A1M4YLF4_9BACT|nr:hypothetical protein SAMN05444362_103203 [Dysgonomonas macrotermitis]